MFKKSSKAKIIISVLLSILMLAGCGSGTSSSDSDKTQANESVATTASDASAASVEKPKVTLKVFANLFPKVQTAGVQNDPIAKEIEKQTGVTLDITNTVSQDDFSAKLAAMTASGDLPDIVQVITNSNAKDFSILLDADAIISLDELIESNGKNFNADKQIKYAIDLRREFSPKNDKKLYLIPTNIGLMKSTDAPITGPIIRWDYYKELGYPAVNSSDAFLDVLEQMQKNHPTASNGKKAYGISLWTDWGIECLLEAATNDGYYAKGPVQLDVATNEITSYYDKESQYWKWTRWYYEANKRGILDPDSLTQKYDQFVAKVAAGQVYHFTPQWVMGAFEGEENQGYSYVDYIPGNKIAVNYGHMPGIFTFAITKNCEYPDRAMDFFNYCASYEGMRTLHSGVKGNTWDVVDGKPTYKKEVIDETLKPDGGAASEIYGLNKYGNFSPLSGSTLSILDNTTLALGEAQQYTIDNMRAFEKDQATHYGVKTPGEIFLKREVNAYLTAADDLMPFTDGDIKVIENNVNNYVLSNWLRPIIAKDDASFEQSQEKFIKDLYDMGYQKLYDWYKDNWTAIQARLDSMEK